MGSLWQKWVELTMAKTGATGVRDTVAKMGGALEPLDLHRFDTPQIEAHCVPDKKNASGGL